MSNKGIPAINHMKQYKILTKLGKYSSESINNYK